MDSNIKRGRIGIMAENGELRDRIAELQRARDELRDAAAELMCACATYRSNHDVLGDDHIDTGRQWDRMRRAENAVQQALVKLDGGG